jgi:hypothetical protein
MKLSLPSYFDEVFFDFIFRRRSLWLHILTKASLGSYFNEHFTLWFRMSTKVLFFLWKMKASHQTLYFDEAFFAFIFWRSFLWLCISMNASLASYFDEVFFGFVFWWGFLWLHILTKLSLTSYLDEGIFGFVFWWRLLWVLILMNASHFDFLLQRRFHFFSEKWRLHTWLRILMKLSLPSYFDEAFFDFVFQWRSLRFHILTKASFGSYFDERITLWLCISMKVSVFL